MRKYLLTLTSVLALSSAYAQTDDKSGDTETKSAEYNRWSVEFNVGQNKPEKPFAPGYFSADSSKYFNFSGVNHYDVGVRYMFNPNFGAKIDFAFDSMENQDGANQFGAASLPFETRQYRVGFQGVANLSRIMKFETFTSRFGVLAHAGIQVSQLAPQSGINKDITEDNGGLMIGLTPQFRISNRIVLTGDFTYLRNVRQHLNWDGSNSDDSNNLSGSLLNTSLGLTFYLGGNDVHADWYVMDSGLKEKIEDVEKRLADVEKGLVDSDTDGVADMFDAEPNSMAGVATDTKGRTIDRNGNGIADELERYFDSKYANDKHTAVQEDDIKSLINEAYVNVYFDFNSKTPTPASSDGINFLAKYLNANPSATADVIGYADEIGSSTFNDNLSNVRATNVKQILVDAGISASRLNVVANGEDNSVNKDSKGARSIVRRVTFQIK
jgi:OOP family OmpA-OmpF porin